jgi:hypothetical protein
MCLEMERNNRSRTQQIIVWYYLELLCIVVICIMGFATRGVKDFFILLA